MNVFDALKSYGAWSEKSRRAFNDAEKSAVKSAVVTETEFNERVVKSVCFIMKSGAKKYLPLSNNCEVGVGEVVDINNCSLVTLSKEGERDIIRVEC